MKSKQLFSFLIAYLFIVVGLGCLAEYSILKQYPTISTPFRFFYWVFNLVTVFHLGLLIPYQKMKDESKKSKWIFFINVNYFIISLFTILLYALIFFNGNKDDGALALVIYAVNFVLFIAITMKASKR